MFFVLIYLISSTLKPGDDPYKILGVSRSATENEIKAAFRQKTKKYHPDINKDPDAEKIWIRCNDAYELLMDSNRRNNFDRTGSVSEESNYYEQTQSDFNFNDFFFRKQEPQINTEFIATTQELKNKLKQNHHCFVYFVINKESSDYAFEAASQSYSHELPFYRIPTLHGDLYHYLINHGSYDEDYYRAYLRLLPSGKIAITPFKENSNSDQYASDITSLKNQYPSIKKLRKLKSYVSKSNDKPLIAILAMEPTFTSDDFREIVSHDHLYNFVLIHGDYLETVKYYKLKHFPAYILFKNGKYIADYGSIKDLFESDQSKTIPELDENDVPSFFALYYGNPSTIPLEKIKDFSAIPIFWTKKSFSNRGMKLKQNHFCFISLKSKKYHVISQDTSLSDGYVDFRKNHKHYENGSPFDYKTENFCIQEIKSFSIFSSFKNFISAKRRIVYTI